MLIFNSVPIMNYLDFKENFDISEIIRQADDFVFFARNHMDFSPLNRHCINVFEMAAKGEITDCDPEKFFWKNRDKSIVISLKNQNTVRECCLYYSSTEDSGCYKKIIMTAAALILADRSFEIPEANGNKQKNGTLCRIETDKDRIVLSPGQYSFEYNPDMAYEDGEKIRTVTIAVKPGYSGRASLVFGDKNTECASGEMLCVNVYKNTVVNILPDIAEDNGAILRRDYAKGCITYNGEPTKIPLKATSYAALGQGRYIYIENQSFCYLGVDSAEISANISHPRAKWVEVAAVNGKYYVLSDTGIVKTCSGTPESMRRHYMSLGDALEGELS